MWLDCWVSSLFSFSRVRFATHLSPLSFRPCSQFLPRFLCWPFIPRAISFPIYIFFPFSQSHFCSQSPTLQFFPLNQKFRGKNHVQAILISNVDQWLNRFHITICQFFCLLPLASLTPLSVFLTLTYRFLCHLLVLLNPAEHVCWLWV